MMKIKTLDVTSRRHLNLLLIFTLLAPSLIAQQQQTTTTPAPRFELTVDSIMRGPALVGYPPTNVRWSRDNQRVFFNWKLASEPRLKEPDTWTVERNGANLRRLTEDEARQAPPASGDDSRDKSRTVFADDGDIFLYDHRANTRRQLTRTVEAEANPRFTADNKSVYFTRANNLYLLALDGDLTITQLTDIRAAGGGAPQARGGTDAQARGTESQETLKRENRELLDAVRERAEKREADEAKRKARDPRKPFQLGANQSVTNLVLAPDGSYVVAAITENEPRARNPNVPNYVTESAYTENIPARTNVGDLQPRTRLALVDVKTGEVKYVEHGQRAAGKRVEVAPQVQTRTEATAASTTPPTAQSSTQATQPPTLSTSQNAAQQGQAQQNQQTQTQRQQQGTQTEATGQGAQGTERAVQLFQVQWSDDGSRAAMLARSADNKDRWVMLLDPATGRTRVLATEHNDAWTNGPGAFTLGWLPDNRTVFFQSEESGFAHLYTVSVEEGSRPVPLTSGQFEVSDVRLSEDKRKFYFTSSEGSFFERHLYLIPTTGGARTRLTTMPGNNAATVSPDEATLAVVRSYSNEPPELYLQGIGAIAARLDGMNSYGARKVTTSPTPEWSSFSWVDPEIVNFRARDNATVYARLYRPNATRRNGAAVIFVHGAGYLQNVHKWWSTYYREYMFHHLLTERGYTVLDIDYRGSAGYGRDWRTGIYRFMGGKDLTDHTDGAAYLTREHNIDAKRIGIYGGSYGGFITFMAMFTTPDVFAAGAALRPVTDWAHYNHPYTSNILNLPQEDREAYERSSPIYHAAGLKGALLICHGMVDTNVHFQDSVRLVQRLIELRKENWELAVYPVEDHAFERPDSWADEYKRILKLFEANLQPRANDVPTTRSTKRRD